jgi:hypothetical protein
MLVLSGGFDDTAHEAARQELVFGGVEEAEEPVIDDVAA